MKTLNLILMIVLAAGMSLSASAQKQNPAVAGQKSVKTESFKVYGNCSLCKERIEKAVKEEGAITASWDTDTKILAVTYDPSKTSRDGLSRKLASVGHDTEKYKAPDEVYNKLPACCHYERAK
jgi:copper chaperone CopZ